MTPPCQVDLVPIYSCIGEGFRYNTIGVTIVIERYWLDTLSFTLLKTNINILRTDV